MTFDSQIWTVILLTLFACAPAVLCESRVVVVTVRDPMARPVIGATVELSCEASSARCYTDATGSCLVRAPQTQRHCQVRVDSPGFTPFAHDVPPGGAEVVADMQLAPLHTSIEVTETTEGPDPFAWKSVNSVSLGRSELEKLPNDPATQIRFAKLAAGALSGADAVYVDGMPAASLPAAGMVERIDVNLDPFSAEFADGDVNRIELTTRGLNRQFRFSAGAGGFGGGGTSVLQKGLKSTSRSGNARLSGFIPGVPVTFSIQGNLGSRESEEPVFAVLPGSVTPSGFPAPHSITTRGWNQSLRVDADYASSERSRVHLSYSRLRSGNTNASAGGLTLPESAVQSASVNSALQASYTHTFNRLLYRGGLVGSDSRGVTTGNMSGPQFSVPGYFVGGGAPVERDAAHQSSLALKNIFESAASGAWSAGVMVTRSREARATAPNPAGSFEFPDLDAYTAFRNGDGTAFWSGSRGDGAASYSYLRISPFFQKRIIQTAHVAVRGGIRTDSETNQGTLVSPLLSGVAQGRGVVFRAGAGLFTREIPGSVYLRALQYDGAHLADYVAPSMPATGGAQPGIPAGRRLLTHLAPGLTPGRELMQKYSLERRFKNFQPAVEFTSTRDWNLTGSRRLVQSSEWVDVIESNRRQSRDRVHAQLRYRFRSQSFAAHYDYIRSRDNTNGPFSYPESQNDLRAEWARTAGVPIHQLAFVASVSAPRGVSLTISDIWHGSAPYDVTTGKDIAGLGLYNDRGGLPRNSGNGPAYNSISLYAHRRWVIPPTWARRIRRGHIDLGLQADNLLQSRNVTELGAVQGSATFGKPISAMPGRSARVWINLD